MLRELKCLLNMMETPRSLTQSVCILLRPLGKKMSHAHPNIIFSSACALFQHPQFPGG